MTAHASDGSDTAPGPPQEQLAGTELTRAQREHSGGETWGRDLRAEGERPGPHLKAHFPEARSPPAPFWRREMPRAPSKDADQ